MNFDKQYSKYKEIFEKYLFEEANKLIGHKKLTSAMKYSLLSHGKRVRPILMLASCEMFGGEIEKVLPFAFALECIHAYSLIHDDLPALDNDDLRRGKPTCHKQFGENIAILAGDALLNLAFEHILSKIETKKEIETARVLAECSGLLGMLGGQASDVCREIDDDEKQLIVIDVGKTSKLLIAPLKMSSILFDADSEKMERLGEKMGLIYQFVDDMLDVKGNPVVLGKNVNKDTSRGKLSAINVYGEYLLEDKIDELEKECVEILSHFERNEFMLDFVANLVTRLR